MSTIKINMDSLQVSRNWKRHKVVEGSNIYRILPPFGEESSHNNYPYRRWSIAWLTDPSSGKRRPYATPLTVGKQACPVKEYNDALKKVIEKKKAGLEAEGATKEQVKKLMKPLNDVAWQVNVSHIYAYNATNKAGECALLEIKSRAHRAMKERMMEYIKDHQLDPTSLEDGVWFNIKRSGEGTLTEYKVEFAQTKEKDEKGRVAYYNDQDALPSTVSENYDKLGFDLSTIYTHKNYDELKDLLLIQLATIVDDVPEAIIEGFEPVGLNTQTVADTPPAQKAAPAAKRPAKKAIALNLEDDSVEAIDALAKSTTLLPTGNNAMSSDDVLNYAENLLKT